MRGKKWLALLLVSMLTVSCVSLTVCATPTQVDLGDLQEEQESLEEELTNMMVRISEVNAEQEKCTKDLKEAEKNVDRQYDNMKERIRFMYEEGNTSMFNTLLASKSMADFINRAEFISTVSDYDRQMLVKLDEAREDVAQKKAQLDKQAKELEALQAKRLDKQAELAKQIQAATEELAAAKAAVASASGSDKYAAEEALEKAEKKAASVSRSVSTEKIVKDAIASGNYGWKGSKLTKTKGVNKGPTGKETYYNLNMSGVIQIMRSMGNKDKYWIRKDGVKMLGDYVIVAANLKAHPRGSYVDTSLGKAIVCDTGPFAKKSTTRLDIATNW